MTKTTKQTGFTLIEVLIFIVVTGLLLRVITLGINTTLFNTTSVQNQWKAIQSAQQCMEWYWALYRSMGYSPYSCPSSPSPTQCAGPAGFTVTTSVSCTTWNGDNNYATYVVTVSGLGNASLSSQMVRTF